jgi:hypothetical protein
MEVELQTAVDHDGASSSKSRRGLPAPERLGTNQNRTTERAPGQPSRPEILFPAESNCAGVNEGKEFASFAGEWTCIAVLLDRPDANVPYAPKFVGLTNRNIGKIQVAGERNTSRCGYVRGARCSFSATRILASKSRKGVMLISRRAQLRFERHRRPRGQGR